MNSIGICAVVPERRGTSRRSFWYSANRTSGIMKGAPVMSCACDYIGEDKVNLALRNFLEKNRYAKGPFPDTRGFVAALREQTPPELQYVITDMFESIVLYENRAASRRTYVETFDKKIQSDLKTSLAEKEVRRLWE